MQRIRIAWCFVPGPQSARCKHQKLQRRASSDLLRDAKKRFYDASPPNVKLCELVAVNTKRGPVNLLVPTCNFGNAHACEEPWLLKELLGKVSSYSNV